MEKRHRANNNTKFTDYDMFVHYSLAPNEVGYIKILKTNGEDQEDNSTPVQEEIRSTLTLDYGKDDN